MAERHKRQKVATFSQAIAERITSEAKEQGLSESELLRRAVDLYFATEDRKKKRQAS